MRVNVPLAGLIPAVLLLVPCLAGTALAADAGQALVAAAPGPDDLHHLAEEIGRHLGGTWIIPFVCMLLSIAVMPLATPHFWHHHYGKVAAFWGLAYVIPFCLIHGVSLGMYQVVHTVLLEYVPFIILLLALFTISGGICLTGTLVGRPAVNTGILLLGTALASWTGTTGAAMLLIRPLLRANAHRKNKVHTMVFFIFLVANIGGSLTPLGDPPLFLGFLKGVSFFWTMEHLFLPMLLMTVLLLGLYFILDSVLFAREGRPAPDSDGATKLGLEGAHNFLFLLGVIGAVLASGTWTTDSGPTVYHVHVEGQNLARDVFLLFMTYLSLRTTSIGTRRKNEFEWAPMTEVAKLFAGIFLSMIPAIAILKAGEHGALRSVIALVSENGEPVNSMYFWLTGALSSFLDNAPTYLVFFNTAGGDAPALMAHGETLAAISAGAVFMGANSYIGNAPNFMVRSIAVSGGVKMPSFFGYMAWSVGILVPCFALATYVFFR